VVAIRSPSVLRSADRLLLVGGWSWPGVIWEPLCERLPDGISTRVVALPERAGDDWFEPFRQPEAQGAVWVGWSFGGMLALEALRRELGRPAALVMVAASPRMLAVQGWPGVVPEALAQMERGLADGQLARVLRRFDLLLEKGSGLKAGQLLRVRQWRQEGGRPEIAALREGLRLLGNLDARAFMRCSPVPVHVLLGEADPLFPASQAPLLRELGVVDVRTRVGEGHWLPLTSADYLAGMLEEVMV